MCWVITKNRNKQRAIIYMYMVSYRQNASEKLVQIKKESQAEKVALKSEIEALKMKEWESRKEVDKWKAQVIL